MVGPRQQTVCVTSFDEILSRGYRFLIRVVVVPWSRSVLDVTSFIRRCKASGGIPLSYASEAIVLASWLASVCRCFGGTKATAIVIVNLRVVHARVEKQIPASRCSIVSSMLVGRGSMVCQYVHDRGSHVPESPLDVIVLLQHLLAPSLLLCGFVVVVPGSGAVASSNACQRARFLRLAEPRPGDRENESDHEICSVASWSCNIPSDVAVFNCCWRSDANPA